MKIAILLLPLFLLTSFCRGGVTINEGQTYIWNFNLILGGGTHAGAVYQDDNKLNTGERIKFSFYENTLEEPALFNFEVNGSSIGSSGFFFLGFSDRGYFQDKQGIFTVSMITGSVYLTSLYVPTAIDGVNYYASITPTAIPEPSSIALIGGGLSLSIASLSLRKKRAGEAV